MSKALALEVRLLCWFTVQYITIIYYIYYRLARAFHAHCHSAYDLGPVGMERHLAVECINCSAIRLLVIAGEMRHDDKRTTHDELGSESALRSRATKHRDAC